jgi:hypothetical protein
MRANLRGYTARGVSMVSDRGEADYWYLRAEEARLKAELLTGVETRAMMLRVAEIYEQLAHRAAESKATAAPKKPR